MKPNLFIVGAPKCGTTAWYRYLGEHPDIFFPADLKEPHFFAHDLPGFRRVTSLEDYRALFETATEPVVGDASVFHLYSKVAAEEIHAFNPASKILIFVRTQSDFISSLHEQLLFTFDETIEDLRTAWDLSGNRTGGTVPSTCQDEKIIDYKAIGRFPEQIERYRQLFPSQNMRVIRFEDWVRDPRSTYVEILEFLGVADDGRTDFPRINEARFHKNRALGQFLSRPPRLVEAAKSRLKKVLNVETFGIADRIAAINIAPGYQRRAPDELAAEIDTYYAEQKQDLGRIWAE